MVAFDEVCQFMDADIVQHLTRRKEQARRDIDISLCRTASPIRFVVFEIDAGNILPEMPSIELIDALLEIGQTFTGDAPAQQGRYMTGKRLLLES